MKKISIKTIFIIFTIAIITFNLLTLLGSALKDMSGMEKEIGKTMVIIFATIVNILQFVFCIFLMVRIFIPIQKVISIAQQSAAGDLGAVADPFVENYKYNDEIGKLCKVFLSFYNDQIRFSKSLTAIANKNLDLSIQPRSDKDIVASALANLIKSNNETLSRIQSSLAVANTMTNSIKNSGASLSKATTEQSGAVEEITATITEIAIQSKQISENSSHAKSLSDAITEFAKIGGATMVRMLESMKVIEESANNISKIIRVINDISFQTNILALNASVEAARAGVEGKGFAVVAKEVRTLAGKSAKAAQDTEELIITTIDRIESGSQIAEDTSKSFEQIAEAIKQNAPLIDSISVATNEQYIGIEQVNQALEQVAMVTVKNSHFAEESANASHELFGVAEAVMQMLSQYKLKELAPSENAFNVSNVKSSESAVKKDEIKISLDFDKDTKY